MSRLGLYHLDLLGLFGFVAFLIDFAISNDPLGDVICSQGGSAVNGAKYAPPLWCLHAANTSIMALYVCGYMSVRNGFIGSGTRRVLSAPTPRLV